MTTISVEEARKRTFFIKVMGRTLEHLGVQMYKRRDVAIAELVANSWDAGASNVYINAPAPEEYDQVASTIVIIDDGSGMKEEQVEDEYLVVGRNRRRDGGLETHIDGVESRPVMGRKGIGKLAGFGIASKMSVTTLA
jgi:HSP90 family molecular chaperone